MADSIGTITQLHGQATATGTDGASRSLADGDPVYENETISVGGDSSALEIRFLDGTILSQGPSSTLVLDEYVFNQESGTGEVLFEMVQGTFRFVTGTIVDNSPENFILDTPLATIGIRGTTTAHHIPGGGQPETHLVLVYDGKPVLIIPDGEGEMRLVNMDGTRVEISAIATSDIQIMTRAEFAYYQQFSSQNLDVGAPRFDSPDDIAALHPTMNDPVSNRELDGAELGDQQSQGQGVPADSQPEENGADDNAGDSSDAGDEPENTAEGSGEEQGEDQLSGEAGSEDEDSLTLDGGTGVDIIAEAGGGDGAVGGIVTLDGIGDLSAVISAAAAEALANLVASTAHLGTDLLLSSAETVDSGPTSVTIATAVSTGYNLSAYAGINTIILSTPAGGAGTVTVTPVADLMADGATMAIDATSFAANQVFTFSGTNEHEGYFDVTCGAGADNITGTNHNTSGDILRGNNGNDKLEGQAGNDTLYGGEGNDSLHGGLHVDSMYGEAGDDTFKFYTNDAQSGEIISGGVDSDTIKLFGTNDFTGSTISGIEKINVDGNTATFDAGISGQPTELEGASAAFNVIGGSAGETLNMSTITSVTGWNGGTSTFTIKGNGGNDTITGVNLLAVANTIYGGSGADTMVGGAGNDYFYFEANDAESGESVNGSGGSANRIYLTGDNNFSGVTIQNIAQFLLQGNAATFDDGIHGESWTMNAGSTSSSLIVQAGNSGDTISLSSLVLSNWSGGAKVEMKGGSCTDTLTGTSLADIIEGNGDVDTINGGIGNDFIEGGAGADILTGSNGNDIFHYDAPSAGGDTITDFKDFGDFDKFEFEKTGFGIPGTSYNTDWYFDAVTWDATGTNCAQAAPTFIYDDTDPTHHKLYYDADGAGSGTGVFIADIQDSTMTNANVTVVV